MTWVPTVMEVFISDDCSFSVDVIVFSKFHMGAITTVWLMVNSRGVSMV